jgi:hydrogenase/urease accessory protein HupE
MKKILIGAIVLPSFAFGHAGHHGGGAMDSLVHALTQPDHVMLAVAVIGVGYAVYRLIKGFGQ